MKIVEEEELRKKWQRENVRRRHNYLPFIVELLKQLASNEQLIPVYECAKQKSIELDKKKKAKAATDDQERAKAEETKAKKQEREKRDKEHKEDIKVLDDLINN